MGTRSVYTETVIQSAPEAFLEDAPYQTAIATLDGGGRVAGRTVGWRVAVYHTVVAAWARDGVPIFRRLSS